MRKPLHQDGRGDFFAVDRRVWEWVCRLEMNPAVAYLVLARGTGGDNRTTKWSTNAIEHYTGISRSRAAAAIAALEEGGAITRDPESKRDHPKYSIVPAHQIPGCQGHLADLTFVQHAMLMHLEKRWKAVPNQIVDHRSIEFGFCVDQNPRKIIDELVALGLAQCSPDGKLFRALYNKFSAPDPEWIWLPNALIDGANGEVPPVKLIRQTGSASTLKMFINFYGKHNLDENGGINPSYVRFDYRRHHVGEHKQFIVWGFVPNKLSASPEIGEFHDCWSRLDSLGLVQIVAHLMDSNTEEGEVIHPMALGNSGLPIEQDVCQAANDAARKMLSRAQQAQAKDLGVVALVPVLRHIEQVQMVGIARLLYKPRTNKTTAFIRRAEEWGERIVGYEAMSAPDPASQLSPKRATQVSR